LTNCYVYMLTVKLGSEIFTNNDWFAKAFPITPYGLIVRRKIFGNRKLEFPYLHVAKQQLANKTTHANDSDH